MGLESTGTYGDVIRYALSESGISVQRVSGKAVSDYHEIFDGVPSQHDGKDAAMVAELVAHGKGTVWPFATLSEHRKMKGLIAMMRKLCKSLWHARVHNNRFDYSLVISGKPPRRRRRRRKAAKKAA